MLRIKALFRSRGIKAPGTSVYRESKRQEWLARLEERGARMRAIQLLHRRRRPPVIEIVGGLQPVHADQDDMLRPRHSLP